MRRIYPKHNRIFALIGRFKFSKQRGIRASMNDFKVHPKGFDALVIEATPCHWPAKIPSQGRGFNGGEFLSAIVQRLPIRQTRAALFHIGGVPPFLDGHHSGLPHVDHIARAHGFVQCFAASGFPDFHRQVQVTGFEASKLRNIIGLHVFHIVAGFFEHLTHEGGGDELARPVMQCQFDRIA